jgi:ATP-binding cassette subfamily C (CFTR/MRP) protein 1
LSNAESVATDKLTSFADTIVALEDGRIAQIGSPQLLLAREGSVAKLGLALPDEEPINEHDGDAEMSRRDSTVAESFISVPHELENDNVAPDTRRKNGDWSVYRYYFASSGYAIVIGFLITMAAWIICTEFASRCAPSPAQFSKRLIYHTKR